MKEHMLTPLEIADLENLIKMGAQHDDVIIKTERKPDLDFHDLFDHVDTTYIKHDDNIIETYYDLYKELITS